MLIRRILLLAFFCGYLHAQEEIPMQDSVPSPLIIDPVPEAAVAPEPIPVSLDSIPQGFSAQIQRNQPPPPAEEPPPPPPEPKVALPPPSPPPPPVKAPLYRFYEDYLDSVVIFARNVLPGKQNFETKKALINEEKPAPKGEYEKQSDYDKRIAGFDGEKQKKIRALEKEYAADEKSRMEKLRAAVNYKPDLQPEWAGILKQDTTAEGYEERIAKLAGKISFMGTKTANVEEILTNLGLLGKKDLETLNRKNRIYMARLDRARELMRDYILQEQAKVLSTERTKFDMALGAYDPEKEQFQVNMNDINSKTVPFDYVGFIKISPSAAQEINRRTDDFLGSVDYINYPFIVNGEKLFPGTKKADIYYKDKAVPSTGVFRNVASFENAEGYIEWAMRADSLISGKVKPRKLDSLYAMKRELPKAAKQAKAAPAGTWWERNKNIVRGSLFVLAAAGTGVAVWQNIEADNKVKKMNENDWYNKTAQAIVDKDKDAYNRYSKEYDDAVKKVRSHEDMRNGFYIGAGVFGFTGILSLAF
ncbi:MAG: hypothetical protein FWH22_00245 [Fibromonadales bacterium]|nr:hypothetical protein [Fibromonadales bacterium]